MEAPAAGGEGAPQAEKVRGPCATSFLFSNARVEGSPGYAEAIEGGLAGGAWTGRAPSESRPDEEPPLEPTLTLGMPAGVVWQRGSRGPPPLGEGAGGPCGRLLGNQRAHGCRGRACGRGPGRGRGWRARARWGMHTCLAGFHVPSCPIALPQVAVRPMHGVDGPSRARLWLGLGLHAAAAARGAGAACLAASRCVKIPHTERPKEVQNLDPRADVARAGLQMGRWVHEGGESGERRAERAGKGRRAGRRRGVAAPEGGAPGDDPRRRAEALQALRGPRDLPRGPEGTGRPVREAWEVVRSVWARFSPRVDF